MCLVVNVRLRQVCLRLKVLSFSEDIENGAGQVEALAVGLKLYRRKTSLPHCPPKHLFAPAGSPFT